MIIIYHSLLFASKSIDLQLNNFNISSGKGNVKIYEFLDITAPLWTANLSNLNTEIFFRSLAIIGTLVLMLKYYYNLKEK